MLTKGTELPDLLSPAAEGRGIGLSGARPETAARPRATQLRSGLLLLEVECSAAPGASTVLLVGGQPVPPPTCAVVLGSGQATRLLFAARAPWPAPDAVCKFQRDGRLLAAFNFGAPLLPSAMFAEREPAERVRVLRFLVESCAPLLRVGTDPEFAGLSLVLGRTVSLQGSHARPVSQPGAAISRWEVGHTYGTGAWHVISRHSVRRIAAPVDGVIALEEPAQSSLVLLPPTPAHPLIIARRGPGDARPFASAEASRPGLAEEAEAAARQPMPEPALRTDGHGRYTALLREVQLLAPARARSYDNPVQAVGGALELALTDHAGGVFLRGWVRDPLGLIIGSALRGPFGAQAVPLETLFRVARPDVAVQFLKAPHGDAGLRPGFVAHLPNAGEAVQWRLDLHLASGDTMELVAPPGLLPPAQARGLVLRAVDAAALRPELLASCITPAVARMHDAALRAAAGLPEVIPVGLSVAQPTASVVVPIYLNLSFLRFQVAAFARDPELRQAELIYVLDSPEQQLQVEHLLRGLAAVHDLPMTLLVQPGNQGYAGACNAGAAVARAPVLLMLNSDILPAAPAWLGQLLRRLKRNTQLVAVGPKLLFADGSLQHAGLFFGRSNASSEWYNNHYFKGFPSRYALACRARLVPAVTGAALCVRRAAFEAVGGFDTGYVVGDYEDSDICLKLRAQGGEIAYEPAAELYHFERQSIVRHAGYAQTLACAYNRRRHHHRWDATITELMKRFPGARG